MPGSATEGAASDSVNPFALQCKTKTPASKMACYRVYFVHRLASGGVDRALAALRVLITTDPDVKRDVHMYAHGIGIDAYQMRPIWPSRSRTARSNSPRDATTV